MKTDKIRELTRSFVWTAPMSLSTGSPAGRTPMQETIPCTMQACVRAVHTVERKRISSSVAARDRGTEKGTAGSG